MALGGGTFTAQNKILNGAYINFISIARASSALSKRGILTMPLELNWGIDNAVFTVTPENLQRDCLKIFGYQYTADEMKPIREIFKNNVRTLYAYKLTSDGVKSSCAYGTAKYCGTRGNDLKLVITANVDDSSAFDVKTYLGSTLINEQIGVASAAGLVDDDFVTYTKTATLATTAGTPFTGGTNGTVSGTVYQDYLDAIESYSFNVMGAATTDSTTKALLAAFCRRMRDDFGAKFQLVLHDYSSADYEGVISVMNEPTDSGASDAALVYWVAAAEAACEVNKTLLNQKYTGEYMVDTDYTQDDLKDAMRSGVFAFHNNDGSVCVLADINTLVTDTDEKRVDIFGENQSIRVMDQIANDIALLFNRKYLGKIPNNADGRISLWADIVKQHNELQDIFAIEDFDPDDVTINSGEAKNAVVVGDAVTIINAMAKLYMTVMVH